MILVLKKNREFNTAEDWKIVREKIVLPNIKLFEAFVWNEFIYEEVNKSIMHIKLTDAIPIISWMFLKTPEELCELVVSFLRHLTIITIKR